MPLRHSRSGAVPRGEVGSPPGHLPLGLLIKGHQQHQHGHRTSVVVKAQVGAGIDAGAQGAAPRRCGNPNI